MPPERQAEGGLAWNVSVTPSALVTMSMLFLVLLGFSFLAGVATGLSSAPLPQALELERLLSEPPLQEEARLEQPEEILPKEELRFMTNLKNENATGVLSDQGRRQAVHGKDAAAQAAGDSGRNVPAAPEQPKAEVPAEPAGPQFDYVLRAAAYKIPEKAQELASRLQKAGLKVRRTQANARRGTWYYVQCVFRGGEEQLAETQARLASLGIRDAMVVSKSPVAAPKKSQSEKKRR